MNNNKMLTTLFWRSFFVQSLWNFERMQNAGFCFVMLPLFRSLYPDREKRTAAIVRHLNFFNVHPYMASIIFGIVASMEKDIAEGKQTNPEDIIMLRTNMAGPLAAIGDTFSWATWRPFTVLLSSGLVLFFYDINTFRGTWLAPLFFLAIYNLIHVPFRFWSLRLSFQLRTRIVRIIAGLEFQRAINTIRYAGLLVLLFVLLFYLVVFVHGIAERAVSLVVFMLAILLGYLRLPPAFIFYGSILLSIACATLGIF